MLLNITAFYQGQQVQEPPCQYSPLRVFQSMFAAPQVEDDDKEADDDDCKVDDDDNKFLFFVSKLLAKLLNPIYPGGGHIVPPPVTYLRITVQIHVRAC